MSKGFVVLKITWGNNRQILPERILSMLCSGDLNAVRKFSSVPWSDGGAGVDDVRTEEKENSF